MELRVDGAAASSFLTLICHSLLPAVGRMEAAGTGRNSLLLIMRVRLTTSLFMTSIKSSGRYLRARGNCCPISILDCAPAIVTGTIQLKYSEPSFLIQSWRVNQVER